MQIETSNKEVNLADCYNGNINLKRAGVKSQMNVFEMDEYMKCFGDVKYFVKNYVKIIGLDEGIVPFVLYPFQERMLDTMADNRFSVHLTPRQFGKTQVAAAYLLHSVVFNREFTSAILANKGDQAREIMGRLQLMYESLPWFIQPGVKVWNKGSVALGNGSKVFTGATSSSSIRGRSVNLLMLDELAFVENDETFFQSTFPVISSGKSTKVIITSTPNGMNLFYKIWTEAEAGTNDFVPCRIKWQEHPKRDQDWFEEQERNMPPRQIAQEILTIFHGSSDTLLSGSALSRFVHKKPIREEHGLQVYEEPIKGRTYVVTADTAEGVGRDSSVCSVFDVTEQPYKHVAKFRSNLIPPLLFAKTVYNMANHYNEAIVVVESNGYGGIITTELWHAYEYENMVTTKTNAGENVISGAKRSLPGVKTTVKTKAIGCSNLKSMIESGTLVTHDFDTIQEFSSFSSNGKSYAAAKGKTDDCVMAMVMFAWFTNEPYFAEMVDLDVRGMLRERLEALDEFNMLTPYFDDGTEEEVEIVMVM